MSRAVDKLSFLQKEELEAIHTASLEVLDKTGIQVKNEAALRLLKDMGCPTDSHIAHLPPNLVEERLKTVVPTLELYIRDGGEHLHIGGETVTYNPGSSAIYFIDRDTGEMRRALSKDLVQLVRLVDALKNIRAQSTAIVPADVPEQVADLYRLYVILKNSAKPMVTGAFTKEGLIDMKNMLESVAGGTDKLVKAPRAIFDVCPSSPLMWSDVTCQNLMDCARFNIPAEIIPAPQIGATSPVTLSGTLIQSNAEILSGVVISQTMNPGAPVIYGGSPAAFDMRYCTARLGAIEAMMVACAGADIGKYYGLPTHAYLGLSDSNLVDAQSGFESGLGIVLAALAGVNVVSGPGMLACENCQSLEKLVIDNEICGMAYRMKDGIRLDNLESTIDVLSKVGPGGHFLAEKHTRDNLKREHFTPSDAVCRLTPDAWRKEGSRDIVGRSASRVEDLLRDHEPPALPKEADRELDKIFRDILRRRGITMDLTLK